MKKFRNYFSIVLVAALAFAASGCMPFDPNRSNYQSGTGSVASSQVSIGVCIYTYDDAYMTSVRQAFQSVAKDMNVDLTMYDSKNDQATQNDQIDMMIERGVQALIINIVDVSDETRAASTAAIVEKAQSANIPLIFVNRDPDFDAAKTYRDVRVVGTNPEESGMIQGELASSIWKSGNWDKNGDGIMQYVQMRGEDGHPDAKARTQYSIETIEASGVKTDRLAEETANWDDVQAAALLDKWKAEIGLDKIEFILCNNDFMAKGAIDSLNKDGYNTGEDPDKYIPVVGVDALQLAIDLINEGKMSGTVAQSAENMASVSLQLAINAVNGKDFLNGTDYNYDDSGIAIRLPYVPYTGKGM